MTKQFKYYFVVVALLVQSASQTFATRDGNKHGKWEHLSANELESRLNHPEAGRRRLRDGTTPSFSYDDQNGDAWMKCHDVDHILSNLTYTTDETLLRIQLPVPTHDNALMTFKLSRNTGQRLPPRLQELFPEIQLYVGQSEHEEYKDVTLHLHTNMNSGIHAQFLSHKAIGYIDPVMEGDTSIYRVYKHQTKPSTSKQHSDTQQASCSTPESKGRKQLPRVPPPASVEISNLRNGRSLDGECKGNADWKGDGWCDDTLNNAACNYDDGDCCNRDPSKIDKSYCDDSTGLCECVNPEFGQMGSSNCIDTWLGDSICDAENNNANCNYDNGDCCLGGLMTSCNPQAGPCSCVDEESRTVKTYFFILAIAATPGFTSYYNNDVSSIANAVTLMVDRASNLLQKELSISLRLHEFSDSLWEIHEPDSTTPVHFTTESWNIATDFTDSWMIKHENSVPSVSYDGGHTFSAGNGGYAVGQICCKRTDTECQSSVRGVTGDPTPIADDTHVHLFLHELLHQFDGAHVFSGFYGQCAAGSPTFAQTTEPGSGTTIMSYAGLCNEDDIVSDVIPVIGVANKIQVAENLLNGLASTCKREFNDVQFGLASTNEQTTTTTAGQSSSNAEKLDLANAEGDDDGYGDYDYGGDGYFPDPPLGERAIIVAPSVTLPEDLRTSTCKVAKATPFRISIPVDTLLNGQYLDEVEDGSTLSARFEGYDSGRLLPLSGLPTNIAGPIFNAEASNTISHNKPAERIFPTMPTIFAEADNDPNYPFERDPHPEVARPITLMLTTSKIKFREHANGWSGHYGGNTYSQFSCTVVDAGPLKFTHVPNFIQQGNDISIEWQNNNVANLPNANSGQLQMVFNDGAEYVPIVEDVSIGDNAATFQLPTTFCEEQNLPAESYNTIRFYLWINTTESISIFAVSPTLILDCTPKSDEPNPGPAPYADITYVVDGTYDSDSYNNKCKGSRALPGENSCKKFVEMFIENSILSVRDKLDSSIPTQVRGRVLGGSCDHPESSEASALPPVSYSFGAKPTGHPLATMKSIDGLVSSLPGIFDEDNNAKPFFDNQGYQNERVNCLGQILDLIVAETQLQILEGLFDPKNKSLPPKTVVLIHHSVAADSVRQHAKVLQLKGLGVNIVVVGFAGKLPNSMKSQVFLSANTVADNPTGSDSRMKDLRDENVLIAEYKYLSNSKPNAGHIRYFGEQVASKIKEHVTQGANDAKSWWTGSTCSLGSPADLLSHVSSVTERFGNSVLEPGQVHLYIQHACVSQPGCVWKPSVGMCFSSLSSFDCSILTPFPSLCNSVSECRYSAENTCTSDPTASQFAKQENTQQVKTHFAEHVEAKLNTHQTP